MTVRLYLDVDGVLNAWEADQVWEGEIRKGDANSLSGNYLIIWSAEMAEAIRELDVEVVWTTTWRSEAAKAIAPLVGFGFHSRHLDPPADYRLFPSIHWKAAAVQRDQAREPGPFIWIDDELGPQEARLALKLGGLAIRPTSEFGITRSHIDMMKVYIESIKERDEQAAAVQEEAGSN